MYIRNPRTASLDTGTLAADWLQLGIYARLQFRGPAALCARRVRAAKSLLAGGGHVQLQIAGCAWHCCKRLKVDIPAGLPDKPSSGLIRVIRATLGFFSGSERAKSVKSGADGCV